MRRSLIYTLFVIGLILLPLSVFTFLIPYLFNSSEGTIEVNWANPMGLKMNNLEEGDGMKVSYQAEINVSLYLLTREEANEFRAPHFYKDPLPDPISEGSNGTVEIDIQDRGDYELLFLPKEPFNTFNVDYDLERDLNRERTVFIFSGICLILTSMVLVILGSVLLKRSNNAIMHK